MTSDAQRRSVRARRLASEYQLDAADADGRFAAVVRRDGQTQLVYGETVRGLLARGELLALVNLDYDA